MKTINMTEKEFWAAFLEVLVLFDDGEEQDKTPYPISINREALLMLLTKLKPETVDHVIGTIFYLGNNSFIEVTVKRHFGSPQEVGSVLQELRKRIRVLDEAEKSILGRE